MPYRMLMLRVMKPAGVVAAICVAVLLAPPQALAGGRGGHSAGARSGTHSHFSHHHSHTRVFIGGSFIAWPGYYYGPAYPYYYPATAAPAEPLMQDPYWYYCEESRAYYPYVKDCAGGWLPVLPNSAPVS